MSARSHTAISGLGEAVLQAAESAGVGVVISLVTPTLRNLFVSPAAARLMGLGVEGALAVAPMDLVAPSAREEAYAHLRAVIAGEDTPSTMNTVMRRADGVEVPIELGLGQACLDGSPVCVVFLRDLTERAHAEQVSRRSEARFRALIESAPDAIVISRGGRIVYANPAAAVLFACEPSDALIGASLEELLHPDDHRTMDERVARLCPGGRPLGPHEYRARGRDGRAKVLEITSILFDDADGPALIAFARDVTDARRLQAQLVRADRLAALGTMAAGVGHEINNPLAFMMLGIEAIDRRLATGPAGGDPSVAAILTDLRHGVERIGAIVRRLRTFSRAEEGTVRAVASLAEVIEAAAKMAAHEITQLGTLRVSIPQDLPPVRGEPTQLEQVFLNLLLNAAQALDETRSDGRIEVVARPREDAMVEVRVTDDGRGIHEDDLVRVFDPFFTTKPVGTGTGLGLPVCHSLVSASGGEIVVESQVGRGTTVRVTLPVVRSAIGARSTPPQSTPRGRGRRLRILVADDELAFLRALEELLSPEHELTLAVDGEEAWSKLADQDVILIDLMMPALNGMELFERIRARRPELVERVVFLTGGASRERVDRFLARVGRPILRKPFDAERVTSLLRRLGAR